MIRKSLKKRDRHSPSLNSPINERLSERNIEDQTFVAESECSAPNYIVNFSKSQRN